MSDAVTSSAASAEIQASIARILDSAPDIVYVLDSEGRVVSVNESAGAVLGYTANELMGKSAFELVHPDDLERSRAGLAESIRRRDAEVRTVEIRFIAKDGGVRHLEMHRRLIFENGQLVRNEGVARDVTEQKRLQEQLQLYKEIITNSQDAVAVYDCEGRYIEQNRAHEALFGYTNEELAGRTAGFHAGEEQCQRVTAAPMAGGTFRGEVTSRTKNGGEIQVELSAFSVRGAEGQAVCHVGFARDISARKREEQRLIETVAELERVNHLLEEKQSQLVQSEKMAALGNLVAGIAHEINTPVGALHSMHDTLMRAVDKLRVTIEQEAPAVCCEGSPLHRAFKVIANSSKVIESGSERVTTIVRSLRNFARLDDTDIQEANLHDGIDDSLMLINHDIKNRVEIDKHYGEIPLVKCYPGRLNQVFLNLLNNAQQAIEGSGRIEIVTALQGDDVHIAITDTGVGIPADKLTRVFDPGYTTKGVGLGTGLGTGLGLSICFQIMQEHGGRIDVKSEVGKGSTFTVVVPREAPPPGTTPQ